MNSLTSLFTGGTRSATALAAAIMAVLLLLPGLAAAAVITNNNLTSQTLADLTTSGSQLSTSFAVTPSRLLAVKATCQSMQTGTTVGGYYIQAISRQAGVASNSPNLITGLSWFASGTYGPTTSTMPCPTATTDTSLYYNLGVGRYDGGIWGWNWSATGITAYQPAGRDEGLLTGWKGNLVPNAGFEDTGINFWGSDLSGTTILTDGLGVQGNNYMRNTSTADVHIGIPVEVGKSYNYSIWVKSAGNDQFEYGFEVPANGYAVQGANLTFGLGVSAWTERTGTITPTGAQTMWYFGGMTNGNAVYFDSVYIQEIPEPATLIMAGVAGVALLRGRRRR